jgi:HlyD family secretion protein
VKKLLVLLILLALVGAGVAYTTSHPFWEHGSSAAEAGKLESSFPVLYGRLLETVTGTGVVEPEEKLIISTEQSGPVMNLKHDVNDVVREGDELLQLDSRVQQNALEQAEAAVKTQQARIAAAQAGVTKAEAEQKAATLALEREQEAYHKGSSSKKAVDTRQAELTYAQQAVKAARAMVAAAQAGVAEANVAVDRAKLAIELTHVRVPVVERPAASSAGSGPRARVLGRIRPDAEAPRQPRTYTIIERKVVLNQLVGPPVSGQLFVLTPHVTQLQVNAQIAEADVHKVAPDQTVYFTVSAYDNHDFTGKVSELRPLPSVQAGSTYYTALVTLDEPKGRPTGFRLQPGMTLATLDVVARVIPEDPKAGVWMVPDAAVNLPLDKEFWAPDVKEAPSPDKKYIWVKEPGEDVHTARPLYLETGTSGKVIDQAGTGLRAETYTEVTKWVTPVPGLQPGKFPFEVITGAQAGKKAGGFLHFPSLFKS